MRFDNWNLQMDTFPVRQYDNLTRRLEVSGDIPEGWSWVALLSIGENLNIISLQYGEPGLYVDLTADMIPYPGKYNLQLKATQGEKVRHTNIVQFTVNESMSGDVQWPELPSAFSQAVEQAQEAANTAKEAANTAKEAALQYPKIIDGYWWVYDANSGKFVNSGIYAGGSAPYIGENGNWFVGGEDTGIAATGQQGWSVSAAALDEDGALVLTIRNPADGSTQQLPPVPIDNSAALQEVVESITAQGTTQVQRVETAGSTAVGEVSTAKDAALQAVDQAQTTAVQAVQTAQGSATDAIGAAQTAAVGAVNDAKTAAMEAVETKGAEEQEKLNAIVPPPTPEDAGKALVVKEDGTGLVYGDAPSGAGIDDAVIATDSTWSSRMIVDSLAPKFSETGAVVTCNPVAGYPLSIQAKIMPVQEGSGDPSPDNVRPISGRDGTNLFCGSKNLFDISKIEDVTANKEYIRNNGDGTLSVKTSPGDSGISTDKTLKKITVPFGQTVYGGTLDWTTGVLTITHEKVIYDGSEEWEFGSQFNGYTLRKEHKYKDGFLPICNIAKGEIINQITGYSIRANYSAFRFQGFADKYPDVDSFKAFLQTQNAEIIAELVTPITVQLTPQEILALSGVNTIYADTGDVTVSGRADPNAVIKQLADRIAALESAAVANA